MDADDGAAVRRISQVTALALGVAVIVVPVVSGRRYRRWLARNDPFEGLDDLILRLKARRRQQQEAAQAVGDLLTLLGGTRHS